MEKTGYFVEDAGSSVVEEPKLKFAGSENNELTLAIVGAAFEVYNTLGDGFGPEVYKHCLCLELEERKLKFRKDKVYEVSYKGTKLPFRYKTDIIVEDKITVGVIASQYIMEDDTRRMINHLAASRKKVGLLLNFGEASLKYKRIIYRSEE